MNEASLPFPEERNALEQCVLVYAPVGRDGLMLTNLLETAHIRTLLPGSLPALCNGLPHCLTVLLTAEALDTSGLESIRKAVEAQSAWSDVPIVLLAGRTLPAFDASVRALGNVTVISRPLSQNSLLSILQSAIRARKRQYEVRDLLAESAAQQAHISALNTRLQRAMNETHHRVKNNLQVISALSELQVEAECPTVPVTAMQRIGQHTRVLAALHDLLTAETKNDAEVSAISTRATLKKLIPLLQTAAGGRSIQAEIEDFLLPIQESASLAMLVAEIVSNSVKHGQGAIRVRLHVQERTAHLEICDEGPGFPPHFDPVRSGNTGFGLIDSTGRHDLRGTVSYKNCPSGGASVLVVFPIALS